MTPSTPHPLFEKTVSSREIFQGRILRMRLDEVENPGGKICQREIVEHPGGAAVLGILPNNKILFIRQYRHPLNDLLLELPAGKLDPGEDPFTTIQRELEEETGYIADHWEEVTTIVTSPGFCNEKITLFKATGLRLSNNPRREEDEYIDLLELGAEDIKTMLKDGRLTDAKSICALATIMPEVLR